MSPVEIAEKRFALPNDTLDDLAMRHPGELMTDIRDRIVLAAADHSC